MDPLVSASLLARRVARAGHGVALCLALGAGVVLGHASVASAGSVAAVLVWTWRLASRLRLKLLRTGEVPFAVDLEIGMLLAVGLDALLLRFDGGLSGTLS